MPLTPFAIGVCRHTEEPFLSFCLDLKSEGYWRCVSASFPRSFQKLTNLVARFYKRWRGNIGMIHGRGWRRYRNSNFSWKLRRQRDNLTICLSNFDRNTFRPNAALELGKIFSKRTHH